jgi:NAD+ synthase (glutamine-hydrolysing)
MFLGVDHVENGFIRVGAAVPKIKLADCKSNSEEIIRLIEEAQNNLVQVLVFPELSLTGYSCGDLFYQDILLEEAQNGLQKILDYTADKDILILVGMPLSVDNQLFNCAVLLLKGNILGVVAKTSIPNHNEFYEKRWFSSGNHAVSKEVNLCGQKVPFGNDLLFQCSNINHLCIGVEICQDLWTTVPPSSLQSMQGATLILNPSASDEYVGKRLYRNHLVLQQSAKCMVGYIYASCGYGESTSDLVYSGHSMISENGTLLEEALPFSHDSYLIFTELDLLRIVSERKRAPVSGDLMGKNINQFISFRKVYFELNQNKIPTLSRKIEPHPFVPQDPQTREFYCREIFAIQTNGLKKRVEHTGADKLILGISGGLDSTLALLVCVETLDCLKRDRKDIIGITMPGFGTSGRTYENAIQLMKNLGISMREISIKEACIQHFKDIDHDEKLYDSTYENAQARERTQILMDIANKENGLVIGTGDLSELALGWATYNGDHMSMYAVNTGVPKTLLSPLIAWISNMPKYHNIKTITEDIIHTPVSPELLPPDQNGEINQKTENILGPYELHDFFLYYMLHFGFRPSRILYLAETAFKDKYSRESIIQCLKIFYKRFFIHQFKRSCLPDGPKVCSVSLSPRGDFRMPSDASYRLWLDEIELLE